MVNVQVLVTYDKLDNGDKVIHYFAVEDGVRRGDSTAGLPTQDEFVLYTQKFLDTLRGRGMDYKVTIDDNTPRELLALANQAASRL